MPEISIIVPVYNMERFLQECLDSIVRQSFKDWECILVDDGSSDKSGEICDEYAIKDGRFKVFHRENGGISAARNTGLRNSSGRYIAFVDPDDVAKKDMLKCLYGLIRDYDADVAEVGYELYYKSFCRDRKLVNRIEVLGRGDVARELVIDKKIQSYLWNKLFKREIIDEYFPEGMVFEDMYVMSQWASNINMMVISPEIMYSYRQRSGSTVNSNFADNRLEYLKAVFRLVYAMRALEPVSVSSDLARTKIWQSIDSAEKTIARHVKEHATCRDALKKIKRNTADHHYIRPGIKYVGLKKWLRLGLLRMNIDAYIWIARLIYCFSIHKRRRKYDLF